MASKHLLFANVLKWTGMVRLLQTLPIRPGLVVLNYHRVGDASACEFDRDVFAASADQLNEQIIRIKRQAPIVGLTEALHLLRHPAQLKHPHVLLTFDDGYLDNYEVVLPVLRANSCSAVFFIISQLVGSSVLPWWDEIAFLIRNCRKLRLQLPPPWDLQVDVQYNREAAINTVLSVFKSAGNLEPDRLLEGIREQAGVAVPEQPRRFMNWGEIRELLQYGMEVGSHTCSHPILSRLPEAEQRRELVNSKAEIEADTGAPVRAFAYPIGSRSAFTVMTERLVLEAGYEVAFSYYGGVNAPFACRLTNVRRMSPWASPHPQVFSTEFDLLTHFGATLSRFAERRSASRNY